VPSRRAPAPALASHGALAPRARPRFGTAPRTSARLETYYRLQFLHIPAQSVGGAMYGYDEVDHTLTVAALVRF
jgi:hypothetical protein